MKRFLLTLVLCAGAIGLAQAQNPVKTTTLRSAEEVLADESVLLGQQKSIDDQIAAIYQQVKLIQKRLDQVNDQIKDLKKQERSIEREIKAAKAPIKDLEQQAKVIKAKLKAVKAEKKALKIR